MASKEYTEPQTGIWNETTLDFDPAPPAPTPDDEVDVILDAVTARNPITVPERRELKLTLQGLQEAGLF